MRHLLSIIFMLSVALGADKCNQIDRQTMNSIKSQAVGMSYDYELLDMQIRMTIVDVGCKNNTFIYGINIETNFYVDNEFMDNMIPSMYDAMIGEYCYKYSNAVNLKYIYYFNNYANSKSITLTKRDCQ